MRLVDALAEMDAAAVDHALVGDAATAFFALADVRRIAAVGRALRGDWLVGAFAQRPPRWSPDEDLPELVQRLQTTSAVLIRDDSGRDSILTSNAVLLALVELAEPFLLIADIEAAIRCVLDMRIPVQERPEVFAQYLRRTDGSVPQSSRDLSMGDYENLIGAKELWPRFQRVYRNQVIARQNLASVREIRNQLFHFHGTQDPDDTRLLAQHRWWFRDGCTRATARVLTQQGHDPAGQE